MYVFSAQRTASWRRRTPNLVARALLASRPGLRQGGRQFVLLVLLLTFFDRQPALQVEVFQLVTEWLSETILPLLRSARNALVPLSGWHADARHSNLSLYFRPNPRQLLLYASGTVYDIINLTAQQFLRSPSTGLPTNYLGHVFTAPCFRWSPIWWILSIIFRLHILWVLIL